MNWTIVLIAIAVVVAVLLAGHLGSRYDASLRRKERAEDWRHERELWELGHPRRERERLQAQRDKLAAFAYDFGSTPPAIADRIAQVDRQLAEMRAEQIRKMTALAEGDQPR